MRAVAAALLGLALAAGAAPAQEPEPETEEALPAGPGREETFGACTGCHATAVIRRSGLSRERWDELMDWMTERHGMAPLEGALRTTIVDYLAEAFPPRRGTPGGRGRNPFLIEQGSAR